MGKSSKRLIFASTKVFTSFLFIFNLSACGLTHKWRSDGSVKLHQKTLENACFKSHLPLVILGGGMSGPSKLSDLSEARVRGLVRFLEMRPPQNDDIIVFSGGATYSKDGQSEAKLMYERFMQLTTDRWKNARYYLEVKSLYTIQNASLTADLFNKNGIEKNIILLTGLYHLERATNIFIEHKFKVCPYIVAGQLELSEVKNGK